MNKTIAQRIVETSKDVVEAIKNGMLEMVEEDQNWNDGITTFTFEDGSKLVSQETEYYAK